MRSGTLAEAVVLEFLVEAGAAFWLREHESLVRLSHHLLKKSVVH